MGGEIRGPHTEVPQPEQHRAAMLGRRLRDQVPASLIVIYCPVTRAWVFYLDSDARLAVAIPVGEVGVLVALLRTTP